MRSCGELGREGEVVQQVRVMLHGNGVKCVAFATKRNRVAHIHSDGGGHGRRPVVGRGC